MVHKWRNQQHVLFSGELKMTAKCALMGRYRPKDPQVDQQLADWFMISDQRSHCKNVHLTADLNDIDNRTVYITPTSCLC